MTEITFEEFPKMARLTRECVITEKIDGTNAQIIITDDGQIGAGSRTRLITPQDDNFGFARWVEEHKEELIPGLGPGRHFGEWWGGKIQRGYGLTEKRFSLFNTTRWACRHAQVTYSTEGWAPLCCYVVPELYRGLFQESAVLDALARLAAQGSYAAPGFMKPEGIVIYHEAARIGFKKTLEKDEQPKGRV